MGDKKESATSRVKQRIKESIETAKEEQKKNLFRTRVELAKRGLFRLGKGQIKEAVFDFKTYIKVLEDGFNVPDGGLTPSLFNREKEMAELLLIAGIYWDLAKVYDRSTTSNTEAELKSYLNKYVTFSKGMPFEPVSSETLRKYIRNGKAAHKQLFRETYRQLSGSKCYVATSLVEHMSLEDLKALRQTRDQVLMKKTLGKFFVGLYEWLGPSLAQITDRLPEKTRFWISLFIKKINVRLSQSESV